MQPNDVSSRSSRYSFRIGRGIEGGTCIRVRGYEKSMAQTCNEEIFLFETANGEDERGRGHERMRMLSPGRRTHLDPRAGCRCGIAAEASHTYTIISCSGCKTLAPPPHREPYQHRHLSMPPHIDGDFDKGAAALWQ